jgi:hypothetical protein
MKSCATSVNERKFLALPSVAQFSHQFAWVESEYCDEQKILNHKGEM